MILDNAVDNIERSIDAYHKSDYKEAIQYLSSGILLLLKYKLYKIHPALIFSDLTDCLYLKGIYRISDRTIEKIKNNKNLSNANLQALVEHKYQDFNDPKDIFKFMNLDLNQDNDKRKSELILEYLEFNRTEFGLKEPEHPEKLKTIEFQEIINRYKKLKESDSLLFNYKKEIELIKKMRNTVEHFGNPYESDQFLTAFKSVAPFINDFIEDELQLSAEKLFKRWDRFIRIEEIAEARIKTARKYNEENQPDYKELATGGEELYGYECPVCENSMLLNSERTSFYCKFCGHTSKYNLCNRCQRVMLSVNNDNDDVMICSECWEHLTDD